MGESSESIRKRMQSARNIQQARFTNHQSTNSQSAIICNADMRVGEVRQFCQLQDEGKSLMRSAMTQLNLSTRAYAQRHVHSTMSSHPEVGSHDC